MKLPKVILQYYRDVASEIVESVSILNSINVYVISKDGKHYVSSWTKNRHSEEWNMRSQVCVSDYNGNAPQNNKIKIDPIPKTIAAEFSESGREILEIVKLECGVVLVAVINRRSFDTTAITSWVLSELTNDWHQRGSVTISDYTGRVTTAEAL